MSKITIGEFKKKFLETAKFLDNEQELKEINTFDDLVSDNQEMAIFVETYYKLLYEQEQQNSNIGSTETMASMDKT